MNDHNLEDLIIDDKVDLKDKKPKNVFIIVALALIFIILIIVALKSINDKNPKVTPKESETRLSGIVTHREKSNKEESNIAPIQDNENEIEKSNENPSPEDDYLSYQEPTPTPPAPKKEERVSKPVKPATPIHKKETKVVKKTEKPTVSPAKLFKKRENINKSGNYYVQIGSFRRMPSDKFFNKIKAKGYTPVVVNMGGYIKVRVGPYDSYDTAKKRLNEIKERLGILGFVVRKK